MSHPLENRFYSWQDYRSAAFEQPSSQNTFVTRVAGECARNLFSSRMILVKKSANPQQNSTPFSNLSIPHRFSLGDSP